MIFATDCWQWAEDLFGGCDLGDPRRTDRLVDYAARQAGSPQASTSQACRGDAAAREGAYRLLRNAQVRPEDIEDGAFDSVAATASKNGLLLAIQDSNGGWAFYLPKMLRAAYPIPMCCSSCAGKFPHAEGALSRGLPAVCR